MSKTFGTSNKRNLAILRPPFISEQNLYKRNNPSISVKKLQLRSFSICGLYMGNLLVFFRLARMSHTVPTLPVLRQRPSLDFHYATTTRSLASESWLCGRCTLVGSTALLQSFPAPLICCRALLRNLLVVNLSLVVISCKSIVHRASKVYEKSCCKYFAECTVAN